jgi:hypothetical protein
MHVGGSVTQSDVVVKVAYRKVGAAAMETEAENYQRVHQVQGHDFTGFSKEKQLAG